MATERKIEHARAEQARYTTHKREKAEHRRLRKEQYMEGIKPGTRCECRDVNCAHANHTSGEPPFDWHCQRDAMRLVTVRGPHVYVGVNPDGTYKTEPSPVPMCAACAEYHEKAGCQVTTAYTLAARETVAVIRESLCIKGPTDDDLRTAMRRLVDSWRDDDLEAVELWARLAADVAGMMRERGKGK